MNGKRVLVTGAASGIGEAVAAAFDTEGADSCARTSPTHGRRPGRDPPQCRGGKRLGAGDGVGRPIGRRGGLRGHFGSLDDRGDRAWRIGGV